MFDRTNTPRMPWHDVALQLIGQPARDLSRHFIQRWNYLLRTKHHSRELPFLLPPNDLSNRELELQRMSGTLEMQICRSCGPWSIGTPDKIEHSIQNAYVKAIQKSEHFVYIENQFFVTSTIVDTTVIENQIGDALVNRIIRAHRENTTWRACIIIPLMPGYAESVDNPNASSVRLIVDCQNRSICRGAHSIFARLRKEGIDPDDYITFFSLRSWGKFKSGNLTSEILYIHAKTMTVDDRLTIIGSANINERSQRGDRDSEIASIIRDTDMIDSQMAGKPYKVGRFNHTLRIRLMREHLGIDVDDLNLNEQFAKGGAAEGAEAASSPTPVASADPHSPGIAETAGSKYWAPDHDHVHTSDDKHPINAAAADLEVTDPMDRLQNALKKSYNELRGEMSEDASIARKVEQDQADKVTNGEAVSAAGKSGGSNLEKRTRSRGFSTTSSAMTNDRRSRRSTLALTRGNTYSMPFPGPDFDKNSFVDPCSEDFFEDIWIASAIYNTEIYRKVFHCTPDDTVTTWRHLKNYNMLSEKHKKPIVEENGGGVERSNSGTSSKYLNGLTSNGDDDAQSNSHSPKPPRSRRNARNGSVTAESGGYTRSEIDAMEKLLNQLKGNLVVYPTKFLESKLYV